MNIIKIFIASYGTFLLLLQNVFASKAPPINCHGLPGCKLTDVSNPAGEMKNINDNPGIIYVLEIISTLLQYVSVIAVIALMLSGVMYLFSAGEDEKIKKAKNWIVWSLVGVIVSISSWFLVSLVNNFNFDTPII